VVGDVLGINDEGIADGSLDGPRLGSKVGEEEDGTNDGDLVTGERLVLALVGITDGSEEGATLVIAVGVDDAFIEMKHNR
jgi:hypothetical protein